MDFAPWMTMIFKKVNRNRPWSLARGKTLTSSDLLRQRYQIGDRVRGRVVRVVNGKRAWLEVEGQRLLADLEVVPPLGEEIEFLVQAMSPKVVLKALGRSQNKINLVI